MLDPLWQMNVGCPFARSAFQRYSPCESSHDRKRYPRTVVSLSPTIGPSRALKSPHMIVFVVLVYVRGRELRMSMAWSSEREGVGMHSV